MYGDSLKNFFGRAKAIPQSDPKAGSDKSYGDSAKFTSLPNNITRFIEIHAYEMFVLYINRMCEQIVSRGFSFNNVKDPLKRRSTNSLADLQNMLVETACQSLVNKDTFICNEKFLSISEIVKRKYLGDARDSAKILDWRQNNRCVYGERRFYAFCFDVNSGAMPKERQQLLGIVEVQQETTYEGGTTRTVFTANLTDNPDGKIEFDKNLIFSMPYAEYLNVFLLGFENLVMMIVNSKNTLGSGDYKIFKDDAGYLDKDNKDYAELMKGIQPFVDGETKSIVMSSKLGLEITKGESAQEIKDVNVDLAKEALSFITSIPQSILFGQNVGGLNSTKDQDKEQEEEFLTTKARLDFLPILHTFCDLFQLEGRKNLDFNSYFESMRVLNLTKEFDESIVDEAIEYKIRESYYKMLNMHGKPPAIEKKDTIENDD